MATNKIVILSGVSRLHREAASKDMLRALSTLYTLSSTLCLYRTTPAWSTGQYTNTALP
jgi:hypothetical protein